MITAKAITVILNMSFFRDVGRGFVIESCLFETGLRLCRLMCGGGSAPPEVVTLIISGCARSPGRSPRFNLSCRKGRALPHIGRRSRRRAFLNYYQAGSSAFLAGVISTDQCEM